MYIAGNSYSHLYSSFTYLTIKYKDGFILDNQEPNELVNVDVIESQFTSAGDNWSVCVTPYDGTDYGDNVCEDNMIILNSIPQGVLPSLR